MMEDETEGSPDIARRTRYGWRDGPAARWPLRLVDDAALVGLAEHGSQLAWDELVRRFSGVIATVARRHRMSGADAADIAQATWVKLYRHVGDLRQPGSVRAWLATTARHECLHIARSRRERPVEPSDVDAPLTCGSDPLEEMLAIECREIVRRGLDKMPERSQQLLELLTWEERSCQDVAVIMSMAMGSIGPTRQRALRRLASQPELARLAAD